jgi:hypothetical protein
MDEEDEDAFVGASDQQLAACWQHFLRLAYKQSGFEIDLEDTARAISSLRSREEIDSSEIYDYLQRLAIREEWGRKEYRDWKLAPLFHLVSSKTYQRLTEAE